MKRLVISLVCGAAVATGTWQVQQTGLNGSSTATHCSSLPCGADRSQRQVPYHRQRESDVVQTCGSGCFNGDDSSFNGIWGNGAETTPPVGRVVGQRAL
ncbi:MAG: hypothetical protein WBE83_12740 [Candidatus Cybelea sp.]